MFTEGMTTAEKVIMRETARIGSGLFLDVPKEDLTAEQATRLADLFEASPERQYGDHLSPYCRDYKRRPAGQASTDADLAFLNDPAIMAALGGLTDAQLAGHWRAPVTDILNERAKARRRAGRVAMIEAIPHPAIRAYLLERVDQRGHERDPTLADCSWMAKEASRQTSTNTRYEPLPGCKATLHLKQGIAFASTQESYADQSATAIPVTIEDGADMAVCKANLARFARALKTHNGFAGSGSTWSLDLIERPEGVFVIAAGRHSIGD